MKQLIITAALSLVASIATIVAAENHPTPSLRGPAALVSGIAFLMTCEYVPFNYLLSFLF